MGHYRFLDDLALADCALDLVAETLDDLFATAAGALAALMVDPSTVPSSIERHISLQAEARDLLLFDWLSELILRKDRDGEIFTGARVTVTGDAPARLEAVVTGAPLDPARMALRNDPKAVTLHAFVLEPVADGWHARLVIDL